MPRAAEPALDPRAAKPTRYLRRLPCVLARWAEFVRHARAAGGWTRPLSSPPHAPHVGPNHPRAMLC